MGYVNVSDGDVIRVRKEGRDSVYQVEINGGIRFTERSRPCDACGVNQVDVDCEIDTGDVFCPACVTRAMKAHLMHAAIVHLIENDDEIRRVITANEQHDALARSGSMQHVDFHSSSLDWAWSTSPDELAEIIDQFGDAIRNVLATKTLIERP